MVSACFKLCTPLLRQRFSPLQLQLSSLPAEVEGAYEILYRTPFAPAAPRPTGRQNWAAAAGRHSSMQLGGMLKASQGGMQPTRSDFAPVSFSFQFWTQSSHSSGVTTAWYLSPTRADHGSGSLAFPGSTKPRGNTGPAPSRFPDPHTTRHDPSDGTCRIQTPHPVVSFLISKTPLTLCSKKKTQAQRTRHAAQRAAEAEAQARKDADEAHWEQRLMVQMVGRAASRDRNGSRAKREPRSRKRFEVYNGSMFSRSRCTFEDHVQQHEHCDK